MTPQMRGLVEGRRRIVAGCVGVVLLIAAIPVISAFKAVSPSDVCVVREGGPIAGRGIATVRQPASGLSFVGLFYSQRCFPATRVETANGDRRVAEQQAIAISATENAYLRNPAQARIDTIKALPANLQALGGNVSRIVGRAP